MNGQGPEAAVASAEPTPTPTTPQAPEVLETPQHQPESEAGRAGQEQPLVTDRQAEILASMDLPEEVKGDEQPPTDQKPKAGDTPATPDEDPNKKATAQPQPQPAQPKAGEEDDKPVPKQWPQSAKQRVAEESAKRKEWKGKAEKANDTLGKQAAKIAELSQRLQQQRPVQVAPGSAGALDDVEDPQQLPQIEKDATELLNFCDRYPNGVENVLLGRTKDGEEIRRNYTPEEIGELRIYARTRKEATQPRAAFLNERRTYDGFARQLYSDEGRKKAGLTPFGRDLVFDGNGELTNDAKIIMQQMPELLRFTDGVVNVARYLRGLALEQMELNALAGRANGAQPANVDPKIAPLVKPQPRIAPTPPKARTPAVTPSVPNGAQEDAAAVAEAENKAIESGGDESDMLALTALLLGQNERRTGGRQPVAV